MLGLLVTAWCISLAASTTVLVLLVVLQWAVLALRRVRPRARSVRPAAS